MKWNPDELRKNARTDFENAWLKSVDLFIREGTEKEKGKRKAANGEFHELSRFISEFGKKLLDLGFSEVVLPVFLEERDIELQRGPEAPFVLEDCFFLGTTDKTKSLKITDEMFEKIKRIAPSFNEERRRKFQRLLDDYAERKLTSNLLLDCMVEVVGVRMEQSMRIFREIFLELYKHGEKHNGNLLLRPDLISAWFDTLVMTQHREPLPVRLFATGMKFGRIGDIRATPSVSFVLMDEGENATLENGINIAKGLLPQEVNFEKKVATSTVFIPGTQHEIVLKDTCVGYVGMLSPLALSQYGIKYPVFCFELSPECIIALQSNQKPKEVLYKQFYSPWELEDEELASLLSIEEKPATSLGTQISRAIVKIATLYGNEPSPREFKVFSTELSKLDKRLEVWLVNKGVKTGTFCGPSYLNEIYVHEGNIVAVPPIGMENDAILSKAKKHGIKTGITLIQALADKIASSVERDPAALISISVGEFSDVSQVNVRIPSLARKYVASKGTTLEISGLIPFTLETRVKRLWRYEGEEALRSRKKPAQQQRSNAESVKKQGVKQ